MEDIDIFVTSKAIIIALNSDCAMSNIRTMYSAVSKLSRANTAAPRTEAIAPINTHMHTAGMQAICNDALELDEYSILHHLYRSFNRKSPY